MTVHPVGLAAVGVAAPGLRLAGAEVGGAWGGGGGRGAVAVCDADEDALTLSWQAAVEALAAAGVAAADVDGLWWGVSRPPFAEGPSHAFLAAALGLGDTVEGALCEGFPHAGMEALLGAWDAVAAGHVGTALVVASDALVPGLGGPGESTTGAGGVAYLLRAGDGAPAALVARATRSMPVVDRRRGDGETATGDPYDGRLFREQVYLPLLSAVGRATADAVAEVHTPVGAWSLADPDGKLSGALAKRLGAPAPVSAATQAALGDTGAAAALLGLVPALAEAGSVGMIGYGGGRATGVAVSVSHPVPGAAGALERLGAGRAASYTEVLRARGQLQPQADPVSMGLPPEGAAFVRGNHEMLALEGAKCAVCGTISTPPSVHPHCLGCGGTELHAVSLARKGTVQTFVVNYTMPPPFQAPLPLVVVDLEDGARLLVQGAPEDAGDLAIGDVVRLTLRRYAVERGVPVYGYKARRQAPGSGGAGREDQVSWDRVAVVGAGLIKFGELFDQSYEQMAAGAFAAAVTSVDKGIVPGAIDAVIVATQRGSLWGQEGIAGNTVPSAIGLSGVPCTRVENACPSGSDAFRIAAMVVASGVHDTVLVIGVEKMRDKSAQEGLLSRAASGHPVYNRGETAPVLFAPFATRHMHEFGTTSEMLASVAVKNHHNGRLDPYAHFQNEITIEQALASPPVCHPLRLLDCCPQTDGAAAMILTRADHADRYTDRPVYVAGFGLATDHPALHEKSTFTSLPATTMAAQRAFAMAGLEPADMDMAEVHDCFTITEILDIEDLGFVEKGKGGPASLNGETALDGRIPVNPSGGLLAKGHPIGATGVAQLTECYWQLREEAGERQVTMRNGYALQHNVGGRGSGVSVVNILSRHRP